jgi:birA, biotin-[acetyl-CoA-carboxylase] ligase region
MKDEILRILIENTEDFTSGEKLSSRLGVSRAAIWKYIKALRQEGYEIHSMTNKGYKLVFSPDILTKEELSPLLHNKLIGKNIIHFDTIDSTNIKAKELASQNAEDGTIVISEEQTCGKGRLGRSWYSPKSKGIWASIILKPKIDPINASKITLIAAASIVKAFNEIAIFPKIKWPNDIVLNNKKVCGILTEMSAELNQIHYLVVGIGINVNNSKDDFTEALWSSATSLKIELASEINRRN